jgi:predicted ATP-grasp superfamily ATP-dependent carboligase/SAM-dependent methyltransferase
MRIRSTDTPVVVLRLDHYGALGIMRSLGRLGVSVHGVHRSADALALRSRHAAGGFVWDLDAEPAERSIAHLFAIAAQLGGRPILIPSNDETALFVAEHASVLRLAFRFQDNDARLVRELYDKRAMFELARRLGIPTPETSFPASREEAAAFAAGATYPVMVKGADGIRASREAGVKMVIVRDAAELLDAYDRIPDPMLQEYIPGGEDAQWMFNGTFDERSECLYGATGRKLRQSPVYTGMTSLGECAPNDVVAAQTLRFMKAIGYRGILDIGYRFDARDRRYKVLDVNPRVGATFRLFEGEGGMDVVRALYLDLTGQPVPAASGRPRRWFVEDLDLVSSVTYHRDGVLGVREYVRSFAGVREAAWFARDDLAPFTSMVGRFLARAVRKARKLGARPAPPEERVRSTVEWAECAEYWDRVYREERHAPVVYRERQAAAIGWLDGLGLPKTSRVLDVGCGAGHAAVGIAARGLRVHAIDVTPEMVERTRALAERVGVELHAAPGDAEKLPFADETFDAVLSLGVLPWLASAEHGIGEMARVLKPGGFVIVSADNRDALHRLVDPRLAPRFAPLRAAVKRVVGDRVRGVEEPIVVRRHSHEQVEQMLTASGLMVVTRATVGFGPFSFGGREVFSEERDLAIHRRLQKMAWRGWPLLRSTGEHVLLLARKPA